MITFTESEVRRIIDKGLFQIEGAIKDHPIDSVIDDLYLKGARSMYNFMVIDFEAKGAIKKLEEL